MEIKQLYYFITLAEYLHFSKAADALYISQSNLSQQIAKLAAELGQQLFFRNNRSVELTPFSKKFLADAKLMIETYEQLKEKYTDSKDTFGNVIRIGYLDMYEGIVLHLIRNYTIQKPEIQIYLKSYSGPESTVKAFEQGELDLIFTLTTDKDEWKKEYLYKEMCSDECSAVVPLHHPLTQKQEIDLEALKNEPFIIISQETSRIGYQEVIKNFHAYGFHPKIRLEQLNYKTILTLIEAGKGISIIPNTFRTLNYQVKFIRIKDNPFKYGLSIIWKKDDKHAMTPVFHELVEQFDKYNTPVTAKKKLD